MCMARASNPKKTDISAVPAIHFILRNTMRGIIMKQINISTKKHPNTFVSVEDCLYPWLSQWKWSPAENGSTVYATRAEVLCDNSKKTILMHRLILDAQPKDKCDHKDGNGLNNLRENLRLCTHAENMRNRKNQKNNSSGFKGVSWDRGLCKWRVQLKLNGKNKQYGVFFCLIKAAKAYDEAAKKYHGEFARVNFPED